MMQGQAAHRRRRVVLTEIAERLARRPAVPEEDRRAVLDAVDRANDQRAEQLANRSASRC